MFREGFEITSHRLELVGRFLSPSESPADNS
jgi:hypothetical protein